MIPMLSLLSPLFAETGTDHSHKLQNPSAPVEPRTKFANEHKELR